MQPSRNHTRQVRVGSSTIGGGGRVVVQSMCATKTEDVAATAVVGRGGLDKSTIFKTVLAGLAGVAMVLIWKNRRP